MDESEISALGTIEDRHWWFVGRRTLLRRVADQWCPRRGVALDIGAAAGGNSVTLMELGWATVALELSELGARMAHGRNVAITRGDATTLPFATGAADLVVLMDVIEHLADDDDALREAHRVLRPGGVLFVAVPADPALWSAHDVAVQHLRRYTRDSLRAVVSGAGFEIADMWSWNVLLRPVAAWHRRRSTGSDLAEVHPVLNALLGAVLAVEQRVRVLRRRPGVSLAVVARR